MLDYVNNLHILGIVFALLVAYIFSFNRKAIDIKPMIMIVIQIVLVLFMMNTSIGLNLLTAMSTFLKV